MKRLLLLAMLCGCDRIESVPPASAPDTASTAVPAAPPVAGDPVLGRWRAKVPDSVLIRRGACPFECCMYSEWALRDSARVYTEPRSGAPVAFVVPDSTRFQADSGFVRIAKLQLVALADTVDQRPYAPRFLPGDTLVVLNHVGEGHYKVFHEGKVYEVEGFWGAGRMPLVASLLGSYEAQWWAHITMKDGRKGWLLIMPPMKVIGADKCAGPPYWQGRPDSATTPSAAR